MEIRVRSIEKGDEGDNQRKKGRNMMNVEETTK